MDRKRRHLGRKGEKLSELDQGPRRARQRERGEVYLCHLLRSLWEGTGMTQTTQDRFEES